MLRAGQTARWTFRVFRPDSDEPVTRFERVHERQYHLFVVSQDMADFQHIHPEPQPDGSWALDVTLPKAGYYKVLSDFMPSGGAAQLIAHPVVTAGFARRPAVEPGTAGAGHEPHEDGRRSHRDGLIRSRSRSSPASTVT